LGAYPTWHCSGRAAAAQGSLERDVSTASRGPAATHAAIDAHVSRGHNPLILILTTLRRRDGVWAAPAAREPGPCGGGCDWALERRDAQRGMAAPWVSCGRPSGGCAALIRQSSTLARARSLGMRP
jgi:hypothetical protein